MMNHSCRVVVGIDDSYAALEAVRTAVDQARRLGATLHAVRVVSVPPSYGWAAGPPDTNQLKSIGRQFVTDVFARALGGPPTDVEVHCVAVTGVAGQCLSTYARRGDLLVLGRAASGPLQRPFGDHTARYCADHANCPVLVVPPPGMALDRHPRRLARTLRRELRRLGDAGVETGEAGRARTHHPPGGRTS